MKLISATGTWAGPVRLFPPIVPSLPPRSTPPQFVIPRVVATRAERAAIQDQCFEDGNPAELTTSLPVRAGVEAEDQQIVGEPVRVQGVVPQDRFLGKAQPLE